jgi:cell wall-associated NlpC family hydrolase
LTADIVANALRPGAELPRNSKDQYAVASQCVSLDNLQVGDLVFWSNSGSASGIHHVAMYTGDGQIAHARNPQMGVAVNAVDYSPWNMMGPAARYSAARHHPGTVTQDENLGAVRSQETSATVPTPPFR